jgi:hypothetical protein
VHAMQIVATHVLHDAARSRAGRRS